MSAPDATFERRRDLIAGLPVVALVTAYNEESTIGAVLEALAHAPSVDTVQVIDDGSTDQTHAIALAHADKVVRLPRRIPVGEAVLQHLDLIRDECVLVWCDADLIGMRPQTIEALLDRFRRGDASQVLSSRGVPTTWPRWARNAVTRRLWAYVFGPLSGERVMLRSDFVRWVEDARRLGWREMLSGYGIVLYLNWRAQIDGHGTAICYFDELRQRYKHEKWGKRGLGEAIAQWVEFIRIYLKIRVAAPRPAQGRVKSENSIS